MKRYALYFAWVIALAGFLLSLFVAEVLRIEPCRLCWYQRIAIVPLALFLGIAAYRGDRRIAIYCLPFSLFGGLVAFYQELIQLFPVLHSPALCGQSGHCDLAGISPLLSLAGFLLISFFILYAKKRPS